MWNKHNYLDKIIGTTSRLVTKDARLQKHINWFHTTWLQSLMCCLMLNRFSARPMPKLRLRPHSIASPRIRFHSVKTTTTTCGVWQAYRNLHSSIAASAKHGCSPHNKSWTMRSHHLHWLPVQVFSVSVFVKYYLETSFSEQSHGHLSDLTLCLGSLSFHVIPYCLWSWFD